jgi:hypothetical protein
MKRPRFVRHQVSCQSGLNRRYQIEPRSARPVIPFCRRDLDELNNYRRHPLGHPMFEAAFHRYTFAVSRSRLGSIIPWQQIVDLALIVALTIVVSVLVNQVCGLIAFILQVSISEAMRAQFSTPASWPAKRAFLRRRAGAGGLVQLATVAGN